MPEIVSIASYNSVSADGITKVDGQSPQLDLSGIASATPSVSLSGGLFGIVTATITKSGGGTYTNPNYSAVATLADGTVTVTDANIDRNLESDSSHLSGVLNFADANASTAERTLTVKVQEFGDTAQSVGATATYTPSSIQDEYIRIWQCDVDGNNVASNNFGVMDWRLYTEKAQGGTMLPPILTSADDEEVPDILVSSGHTYSAAYADFKAFDNDAGSSWWWSIGNYNAANQWLQIQFEDGTYTTKPIIKSMKIRFHSSYAPPFFKVTSSPNSDHSSATTHLIISTSGENLAAIINYG